MKLKLWKNIAYKSSHAELVSASQRKETLKQVQGDIKRAFTLAEVLITLTIIGVIAALTIPNLMRKWEDQHTVSAVKEAYSILNNAIKMAVLQNGPVEEWDWPDKTTNNIANKNANYIVDMLKPYLKFSKICYSASGCMGNVSTYKDLNGSDIGWGGWTEDNTFGKAILSNGMAIAFADIGYGDSTTKTSWHKIKIDINGKKGPNRYGYDVFYFSYNGNSNKLIGGRSDRGKDYCSINGKSIPQGVACGYWVIKHGNVDYKYRDVSAEW